MMKKVNLVVYGNLIVDSCQTHCGGGDIVCNITLDDSNFDFSEAVILKGDITASLIVVNGIVAVTGGYVQLNIGG